MVGSTRVFTFTPAAAVVRQPAWAELPANQHLGLGLLGPSRNSGQPKHIVSGEDLMTSSDDEPSQSLLRPPGHAKYAQHVSLALDECDKKKARRRTFLPVLSDEVSEINIEYFYPIMVYSLNI